MKIAIHEEPGSFSDRWIKYCQENDINYKLVNCYDSDIVAQLDDCFGLMWHWDHNNYKAILFARQLALSLESKDIRVFPDVNTAWHFDDKVGQKYLLESIKAPFIKSYVFYEKANALNWMRNTCFPKVFKLRGGAGSVNVLLVKNKKTAKKLIHKAFTNGFLSINRFNRLKDRIRILNRDRNLPGLRGVISGISRLFFPTEVEKFSNRQKGYIYFQDFIPNNDFDTRVKVVGNRCYGMRRFNRKGDFRASGSEDISLDPELIDKRIVRIAFDTAKKLKLQSVAFDFIFQSEQPKIVELSYCFPVRDELDDAPGYWDFDLNWYNKPINAQYFMIEDFLNEQKMNTIPNNENSYTSHTR